MQLKTVAVRDDGCFSVVLWDGRPVMVSVERTFENNRIVIGNGIFVAVRDFYHKGGYETFEVQVSGHDRVMFHRGAIEDHSLACVILGESFGAFNRVTKEYGAAAPSPELQTAILGSSAAFSEFMTLTAGLREFNLWVSGR